MLVVMSGYYMWWGGESFAPRHLTPIMLFLVIPLAALASKIKPWLIVSTIFSTLQMFLVVSTSLFVPDTWVAKLSLFHPFEPFRYTILYSTLLPQFIKAGLANNLGRLLIANPFASLLPFIIIEGALCLLFYFVYKNSLSIQ